MNKTSTYNHNDRVIRENNILLLDLQYHLPFIKTYKKVSIYNTNNL